MTLLTATAYRAQALPDGRVQLEIENADAGKTLYDRAGVARRLGVSIAQVDKLMRRRFNPLPHSKATGSPRFMESDVQGWVESGQKQKLNK